MSIETFLHTLTTVIALLALVVMVPLFAQRMKAANMPQHEARKQARRVVLTCAISLGVGTFGGPFILSLLGIPIPALAIVGGYVAWITGYQLMHEEPPKPEPSGKEKLLTAVSNVVDMLKARVRPTKEADAPKPLTSKMKEAATWVIVPFSFPLVAGPGISSALIATKATFTQRSQYISFGVALLVGLVILWVALHYSTWLLRLNESVQVVINKVNAVILLSFGAYLVPTNITKLVVEVLRQMEVIPRI